MEIIVISAFVGIVLFAIGIVCGKSSPCSHEIYCDSYSGCRGKLNNLELEVSQIKAENERLNFLYTSLTRDKRTFSEYMAAHCGGCDRTFYAKTPKEQEVADMLKKLDTSKGVEELAKKLDIKMR